MRSIMAMLAKPFLLAGEMIRDAMQ